MRLPVIWLTDYKSEWEVPLMGLNDLLRLVANETPVLVPDSDAYRALARRLPILIAASQGER